MKRFRHIPCLVLALLSLAVGACTSTMDEALYMKRPDGAVMLAPATTPMAQQGEAVVGHLVTGPVSYSLACVEALGVSTTQEACASILGVERPDGVTHPLATASIHSNGPGLGTMAVETLKDLGSAALNGLAWGLLSSQGNNNNQSGGGSVAYALSGTVSETVVGVGVTSNQGPPGGSGHH